MIVAEVGSNWHSKTDVLTSIEKAAEAGADAVKFQLWTKLYNKERMPEQWAITQKYKLPLDWLKDMKLTCRRNNVQFHLTIFNPELFDVIPVPDAIKVASGDLTYEPLLGQAAIYSNLKGIPLVLSTGTHTQEEVDTAVGMAMELSGNLVVLNCVSLYPAEVEHYDLNWMMGYRGIATIGLSDHTLTGQLAEMAVEHACHYCWFEKHFTLDSITDTPDVGHAVTLSQFRRYVEAITRAERRFSRSKPIHPQEEPERILMQRGKDGLRPRG